MGFVLVCDHCKVSKHSWEAMMKVIALLVIFVTLAAAGPLPDGLEPHIPVLERTEVRDEHGQYALSYLTANGIATAEQGALKQSNEGNVLVRQGSWAYLGPDNVKYVVNYVADENGYRATGSHLPEPPAS